MYILTIAGREQDGAYSVVDDDGDDILYLFQEEDDATRYAHQQRKFIDDTLWRIQKDHPFCGIQVIFCGDFLQLPPICKQKLPEKYIFQSKVWRNIQPRPIVLQTIHRQPASDKIFIDWLQKIRRGVCPPEAVNYFLEKLRQCAIENRCHSAQQAMESIATEKNATQLTPTNFESEKINTREYNKLDVSTEVVYSSHDQIYDPLKKVHEINIFSLDAPIGSKLHLRIGTRVMLRKNIHQALGLVNGSVGVVTDLLPFEDVENELTEEERHLSRIMHAKKLPVVTFASNFAGGAPILIAPVTLQEEENQVTIACRTQIPLTHAWAFSIHKSQGMSIDTLTVSLSKTFADGQAYVALSRARFLDSLWVFGLDPTVVRACDIALSFHDRIQREQDDRNGSTPQRYAARQAALSRYAGDTTP